MTTDGPRATLEGGFHLTTRPHNLPAMTNDVELFKAYKQARTILGTTTVRTPTRPKVWEFAHLTAGYRLAGSVAAWSEESWSVSYYDSSSNTTHGRRFNSESAARVYFESV